MRAWALAGFLAVAAGCVVVGVGHLSEAAAWIVGGVLFAAWSVLVLSEAGE